VIDSDIEALDLRSTARAAAYTLKASHPYVMFTSGRRSPRDQARAMSQNVAMNRRWIEQTYRDSIAIRALQTWVSTHEEALLPKQIELGLFETMMAMPARQLASISKHLSGDAWDVHPIAGQIGEAVKATIRALPGLHKFLEREGGLVRWHAQFVQT
jgi:hypothetical protein